MEKLFKMMTNAFYPALFLKVLYLFFSEGRKVLGYIRLTKRVNSAAIFLFIISVIGFIGYAIVVCKQPKKDQPGSDKP